MLKCYWNRKKYSEILLKLLLGLYGNVQFKLGPVHYGTFWFGNVFKLLVVRGGGCLVAVWPCMVYSHVEEKISKTAILLLG